MNILVLNGSPKGKESVTLQYVKFIENKFPNYKYDVENIAQRIKRIEKDESVFNEIMNKIESADAVIWSLPVYVLLVPAQIKRFIELVWERNKTEIFKNKYTSVITTSIHFYDNTANNYMRAVCEDLEMKYVDYFSAHMRTILKSKGQKKLKLFAEHFFETIEQSKPVNKLYYKVEDSNFSYKPNKENSKISCKGKKILIVTDNTKLESNISKITEKFKMNFTEDIEEINISEMDIKGGCLGCLQCAYDNTCQYEGKDEFIDFFKTKFSKADVIIMAGEIKDRFLSARWKMFMDRSFFNNHTPKLIDKQVVYLISGQLSKHQNIKEVFSALMQIHRANIIDFITDESENSQEIDELITETAKKAVSFSEQNFIREQNFLGVGGMKIFRDDIYGPLHFPFIADYKAYKKLGIFSFSHRKLIFKIVNGILISLVRIPKMRNEIYKKRMVAEIVKPYKKVISNL